MRKIPHNVGDNNVDEQAVVALSGEVWLAADTPLVVCVDTNLWYILGYDAQYKLVNDLAADSRQFIPV